MLPARTIPAVLAGAETSRMSSSKPTAMMAVAPRMTPSGSVEPPNTSLKRDIRLATAIATRNAMYIDTPPAVGRGSAWTLRSTTGAMAPVRTASRRPTNVSSQLASAEMIRTRAYATSRVQRELAAQHGDVVAHGVDLAVRRTRAAGAAEGPHHELGDLVHLRLLHAGRRHG